MMGLGEKLLLCGAEVYRVEDTVKRVGKAYGARYVNVFVVMSMIMITITFDGAEPITVMRRAIKGNSISLRRLMLLNSLSRRICAHEISVDEARAELEKIDKLRSVSLLQLVLGGALSTAAFAFFFGGTLIDSVVAALVSTVITTLTFYFKKKSLNGVMSTLAVSFSGGLLALLFSHICGASYSADVAMIADIMIIVPGMGFTNALRDLMTGDTMTGTMRLAEVLMNVLAIAGGYAAAILLIGGGVAI